MPARRKKKKAPLEFEKKLVLQQWIFSLLEARDLEDLCDEEFRHPDAERWDSENITEFHHLLTQRTVEREHLPDALLLDFDQNIVRHTRRINGRRGEPIRWKYYQYVALLFTEIYLHWYFHRPADLLRELNRHIEDFNAGRDQRIDEILPCTVDDLRKLCFWQATGSGKTLQMHVNLLQYLDHLEKAGRRHELNRIILLTPKEGLSRQHLEEFANSGIDAEIFDKEAAGQATMFAGQTVEILEVSKLTEESKEKTVAVEAFEGNNLVLVDEGHRGATGEDWMRRREMLCREGFSFEYSATFGQAVKTPKTEKDDDGVRRNPMEQRYARWILFDYSYRFFHHDGYGKHYRIFNLRENMAEDQRQLYLTAGILSFYQQLKVWGDHRREFAPFQVERPLWVFFGAKVNAGEISDIVNVLLFLAAFVKDREESIRRIERLLDGKDGLVDLHDRSLFAHAFPYLKSIQQDAVAAYEGILRDFFNAPSGGKLHVRNLKSVPGELSLSLGEAEPFGVINVGDDSRLHKLCAEHPALLATSDQEIGGSLFHGLSDVDSNVHLLLGSKKFTEGWNSWRVSAIGLMNMGKSEGSDVIQLFGRGVRLKGWDMTLKRSEALKRLNLEVMRRATEAQRRFLPLLETLDVFGVHADYMAQFREYLEREGVKSEPDWEELSVPVLPTLNDLPAKKLKIIRVPENLNYKRDAPRPDLEPEPDLLVRLDWYPRIEALEARSGGNTAHATQKKSRPLTSTHLAFLDYEALHLLLQRFKRERAYHNLGIDRDAIPALLADTTWYELLIPEEELEPTRFDRVRVWQQIAEALLTAYCERLYKHRKQGWESEHAEVQDLSPGDPNFFEEYRFEVQSAESELVSQIATLAEKVREPDFKKFSFGGLKAGKFDAHLYSPLIHIAGSSVVSVSPVHLNEGEWQFIEDLKKHHVANGAFFENRELYVLRNRSKQGIGFFEAGNFYPDFIVWLIDGDTQYLSFVDPKGLRNTQGFDDPKIAFAHRIKELEARLKQKQPGLVLNSFILATTSFRQIKWWDKLKSPDDFADAHVLLQTDEPDCYLKRLFELILRDEPTGVT